MKPYLVLAAFCACAVGTLLLIPSPVSASAGARKWGVVHGPSPTQRALTGGVVSLRSPGAEMILVPFGTFTMGSSVIEVKLALEACRHEPFGEECREEMFDNEREQHRVSLFAYWLDRTEVTVMAYQRCVDTGACAPSGHAFGGERFRQDDYPVSLVSWSDAKSYGSFVGKRLPTEAEWERAARGRTGRRFPWGNQYATRRANHGAWAIDSTDASDGYAELAPVGSFPDGRTPERFDDLAGNVAEWTADAYEDAYEALPVTNPKGPAFGAFKSVRGGAFLFGMPWLRSSARMFRTASTREPYLGFRCARDAHHAH